MKTGHLAKYAPAARRAFIAAVTSRAAAFGLTANGVTPMTEKGDVVLIGDKPYPRSVAEIRRKLEQRIKQQGFVQVMETMAYTWFNRLVAIRYMELHGYLDHGRRVLSHPNKPGGFEILDACTEIDLPGLDRNQVLELKLDGNKDEELYRLLLLGQCRALHQAMPFLFEAIEDETELLLPDNLTKTDSLIRRLVDDIPEEDWQQVEIVGWLYQFYISEKKDQVIGKVVKSEDIPAATQLFTPNWIVKYMVQNSLGAQWLATYPDSPLKGQLEYYIEPAEQTEKVQEQLKAITPTRLDLEELTLIDPACGSGHILVEAYELFKAIYLERGYRQRDIPKLILEKNLFGLEIDPRAAQLTGFALLMKGRADDRRLFERGVKLNVMALLDSAGFDTEALANGLELADYGLKLGDLRELTRVFEYATTFGSLIQLPESLTEKLPALKQLSEATSQEDLFLSEALKRLRPLMQQAELLAAQYDAVVANPPYMGMGAMNSILKAFILALYPEGKIDVYAAFILRGIDLTKDRGSSSLITMHSWLFVMRFEALRRSLLSSHLLGTLVHLGSRTFSEISGEVVQVCAFTMRKIRPFDWRPTFFRLLSGDHIEKEKAFREGAPRFGHLAQKEFLGTPGTTVSYWAGPVSMKWLSKGKLLGAIASPRHGMVTSDNDRFLRRWHEVSVAKIGRGIASRQEAKESKRKWFPYNKGGSPRRWYGNTEFVVNWENDGAEIIQKATDLYGSPSRKIQSPEFYFRSGLTWSSVTMKGIALRANGVGWLFDSGGSSIFFEADADLTYYLGVLNSSVATHFMRFLSPTINVNAGDLARIPLVEAISTSQKRGIASKAERASEVMRAEYSYLEEQWEFCRPGVFESPANNVSESFRSWFSFSQEKQELIAELQAKIDQELIALYALEEEIDESTQSRFPQEWGNAGGDPEHESCRLVSYAIGCMMGRYSLDEPALIYAHSGSEGFDLSRYPTFPADDDGIIPLTDTEWFDDDAAHRLIEFISVAWDKSHLEANLTFLADNLSPRRNESSRDTLRRYLCDSFFKDHLQTYKNRPIYWLFSSGKHKAFQCLVYLHRYNEGTLARMRTEYVIPLQGLIASRIERLDADILAAGSTAHRKRLEKEKDKLVKQRTELQNLDEKLRHYADQRIKLDLDDGVKVNYGKFGDLLAEVKKVTGKKAET